MRIASEISGTTISIPTLELYGSRKNKKRNGMRKYLRRL